MNKRRPIGRIANLLAYIFCEKDYFFSGECSLREIKAALHEAKSSKYSWLERGNEVHVRRKSILLPASHYMSLRIENKGIHCKIRIRAMERFLLMLFLSATLLTATLAPLIALAISLGSPSDHNLVAITFALIAVSIALMAWLKLVCLTLSYISGISKLADQIRWLAMQSGS